MLENVLLRERGGHSGSVEPEPQSGFESSSPSAQRGTRSDEIRSVFNAIQNLLNAVQKARFVAYTSHGFHLHDPSPAFPP